MLTRRSFVKASVGMMSFVAGGSLTGLPVLFMLSSSVPVLPGSPPLCPLMRPGRTSKSLRRCPSSAEIRS